jgi:hypothetical protein
MRAVENLEKELVNYCFDFRVVPVVTLLLRPISPAA